MNQNNLRKQLQDDTVMLSVSVEQLKATVANPDASESERAEAQKRLNAIQKEARKDHQQSISNMRMGPNGPEPIPPK